MLFLDADNNTDDETNLDEMDQDENNELEKRFHLWELNYFKDCRFFQVVWINFLAFLCMVHAIFERILLIYCVDLFELKGLCSSLGLGLGLNRSCLHMHSNRMPSKAYLSNLRYFMK